MCVSGLLDNRSDINIHNSFNTRFRWSFCLRPFFSSQLSDNWQWQGYRWHFQLTIIWFCIRFDSFVEEVSVIWRQFVLHDQFTIGIVRWIQFQNRIWAIVGVKYETNYNKQFVQKVCRCFSRNARRNWFAIIDTQLENQGEKQKLMKPKRIVKSRYLICCWVRVKCRIVNIIKVWQRHIITIKLSLIKSA